MRNIHFRYELVVIGLFFFLLIFPLFELSQGLLIYLFLFFVYLTISLMWNLLAGYSGLVSLCQPAFFGLAGYVVAIFSLKGLPLYVGLFAGAFIACLFGLAISFPVFRLSGIYFSIGTLVIPEALRIFFFLWRPIGGGLHGGGAGYMIKGLQAHSIRELYILSLIIGIASFLTVRRILGAKLGMGLAAIRDNQRTAASCGIDVFRLKLYSFLISAFFTGLAGSIFYIYQGYIEPASAFNIKWTMIAMLSTVIGGLGTPEGPVIGSAFVILLHFLLAKYGAVSLLIQGIILVGIMLILPEGIRGSLERLFKKDQKILNSSAPSETL